MVSLSLMQTSQLPELERSRPDLGQAKLCSLEGGDPSGWCPVLLRPEKGASLSLQLLPVPLAYDSFAISEAIY